MNGNITAVLPHPRLWRSPAADFHGDEPLSLASAYTSATLEHIRSHGFDAIWARGRLRSLMRSSIFPSLNDPMADARIEQLREVIERGKQAGIDLYLFFNEPLALPSDHPFWSGHEPLRGEPYESVFSHGPQNSLCTSTPQVRSFIADAIDSVISRLSDLGGVILITASEFHTHCWSHHARFGLDDGFVFPAERPLACPRCAAREPADVVLELLSIWEQQVHRADPRCRLLAWNWSWSMWYPDPQPQIVTRLPKGVELLADWERGGRRHWRGKSIVVDEYSLCYAGPSDRFTRSQELAQRHGIPAHTKLQIGTTHEVATVPNLPLIGSLYRKLAGLHHRKVQGVMGTWCFGTRLTLNTFACGLFWDDPVRYAADEEFFLHTLAQRYFQLEQTDVIVRLWHSFEHAFAEMPFSIKFVYFSPVNYAPAALLTPQWRDAPLKVSHVLSDDYGDRLEDCLAPFKLEEVVQAVGDAARKWMLAAEQLNPLLSQKASTEDITQRRQEELSCARMIGHQLLSTHHLFAFHYWRKQACTSAGMAPPCTARIDRVGQELMKQELENVRRCLPLVAADRRLGYHEEARGHMYDERSLRAKSSFIERQLEACADFTAADQR